MSEKFKIRDQDHPYFITITVQEWVDVFIRLSYKELLVQNLKYCQHKKGLQIHAWCLMSSHLHLIASKGGSANLWAIIRDFKKFTSVQLCRTIKENPQESRREWLLSKFSRRAQNSTKHQKYSLWQEGFHPIELSNNYIIEQKIDYIHQNPVKEGIVSHAEHYVYSSASSYSGTKGLLDVQVIE